MNSPLQSIDSRFKNSGIQQQLPLIPAFSYRRAWDSLRPELEAAMLRVMESGTLILGPEVSAFEKEFAGYVGTAHAIGASSGTDALILAMRALDIGPNDEVLTVANGPVPTASAIHAVGALARFVDVDSTTLQMCPLSLAKSINARTKCIIPIHLYGQAAPIREILQIANTHSIPVIEDCAQAHGTRVDNQHVGNFGAIGCFSFYPTKNLGAFGDAGMCVTNDPSLAASLQEIGCYGIRGSERIAVRNGLNGRLDELQAAFLRVRLPFLEDMIFRRSQIASLYQSKLQQTHLQLPMTLTDCEPSWHQFVVRTTKREAFIEYLANHRIASSIHYRYPVHRMPAYRNLGDDAEALPITERACDEVVSLPMFPELRDEEVDRIVEACNRFRG